MAKKTTIENRVFLFDSLAEALLGGPAGELLVSSREGDRIRAMRALADAAYVSCVVSDTGALDAAAVRDAVLAGLETGEAPSAPPPGASREEKRRKRKKERRPSEPSEG